MSLNIFISSIANDKVSSSFSRQNAALQCIPVQFFSVDHTCL